MALVGEYSIETFRGDCGALEAMARRAWLDEYGADSYPNLYRPDLVAQLLAQAGDPELAIAAYRGDEPVGFLLNLPRRMVLRGVERRAALSCSLVVSKECLRQGIAKAMFAEALERNRRFGFEFTLFYLEAGHTSSKLFETLAANGTPLDRLKRMHVVARALDLDAIRASEKLAWYEVAALRALTLARPPRATPCPAVREARAVDAPRIAELLDAQSRRATLGRLWTAAEARREILAAPLSRALVWERDGRIDGVLAWISVDHVGRRVVPWAWLNHVCWDALRFGERRAFLEAFGAAALAQGCAGVIEWNKGYYPSAALYAARFFPYPRQVDFMAWRFGDGFSVAGIPDVAEIQL